jgi:hypothetical protein
MKNLEIDETIVIGLKENTVWNSPAKQKKYNKDFFLPKFGLSTTYKETIKLGAYPKMVKI